MDQPTAPGAPRTPLDAERERLRKQGYTDAEVSQILISRAAGGQPQTDGAGHGPMSGVASNVAAASTYAKNFVPGMAADLATVNNPTAPPAARSQATLMLAVKIVAVAVIAYVVWLEFSQLISGTQRATVETCAARQKLIIDTEPFYALTKSAPPDVQQKWDKIWSDFHKDCDGVK